MKNDTAPRASFDAVADGYDDRFSNQHIARMLRTEVQDRTASHLPALAKVLEIGCGTGEDSVWFASNGCEILATDASSEMVRVAAAKLRDAGLARAQTMIWVAGTPAPDAMLGRAPFDLVFSNFGVVNCIGTLSELARTLSGMTRTGSVVVVVTINRWCLLEVVLGALMLNPQAMSRRFKKRANARLEDGSVFPVVLHSVRDFERALHPDFVLCDRAPVGAFLPPSELYTVFQNRPRVLRLALWLDRTLGRVWPFSRLADHQYLAFRRI